MTNITTELRTRGKWENVLEGCPARNVGESDKRGVPFGSDTNLQALYMYIQEQFNDWARQLRFFSELEGQLSLAPGIEGQQETISTPRASSVSEFWLSRDHQLILRKREQPALANWPSVLLPHLCCCPSTGKATAQVHSRWRINDESGLPSDEQRSSGHETGLSFRG